MSHAQILSALTSWPPADVGRALGQKPWVRLKKIPKKNGKMRTVAAPPKKLKALLRALHRRFHHFYTTDILSLDISLFDVVHGFVTGHSPATNARAHLNNTEFFICDLKGAFGQITTWRVWEIFAQHLNHLPIEWIRALVETVTYHGAIPEGFPTSPVFLNLSYVELDLMLLKFTRPRGITYTRYSDDMCFSCSDPEVLDKAIPGITAIIESQFKLAHHKSRRLSLRQGAVEITGVCIVPDPKTGKNRLGLPGKTLRQYRSLLEHYNRGEVDPMAVKGMLGWVRNIYPVGLPSALQGPYLKLLAAGKIGFY